ncbi:hypothetical protein A2J03_09855 [Rhodococcus sp. EPR-157]|uniref:DUF7302 family protein n=1 Tax=Rhodococcus sp. EPR-157 TaxID=1813677 RepID=UPI0007BBF9E7|nr:hypothetical protein [Rhodococcus sp. EPR-157]KZF00880.1 hypothetical protein A2J03_09855 [Rhodococcus sp. EPR-157]
MMRLRNADTNVQVVVTDSKAVRLIAEGTYEAVPDVEQPPVDTTPREQTENVDGKPGPTSIAAALKDAVGPMWDHAG